MGVGSFTFQELREMRARGQISDQEFAAMRAALLAEMGLPETDESAAHGAAPAARQRREPPLPEPPAAADGAPPADNPTPPAP